MPFIKNTLPSKIACQTPKNKVAALMTIHFHKKTHNAPIQLPPLITSNMPARRQMPHPF